MARGEFVGMLYAALAMWLGSKPRSSWGEKGHRNGVRVCSDTSRETELFCLGLGRLPIQTKLVKPFIVFYVLRLILLRGWQRFDARTIPALNQKIICLSEELGVFASLVVG